MSKGNDAGETAVIGGIAAISFASLWLTGTALTGSWAVGFFIAAVIISLIVVIVFALKGED